MFLHVKVTQKIKIKVILRKLKLGRMYDLPVRNKADCGSSEKNESEKDCFPTTRVTHSPMR